MPVQPFGFDRIFRFSAPEPEPEAVGEDLAEQVAALEARLERMQEQHVAELARARVDGFEAGQAQVRHEREEALLASSDALQAALEDARRDFAEVSVRMVREAAAVAYEAARMLAGHASAIDPGKAVDEALGRALEQVARGTSLVLKVHPEMVADVEHRLALRGARDHGGLSVTVVADDRITSGDARISWAGGGLAVDAKARSEAVLAELNGLLAEGVDA